MLALANGWWSWKNYGQINKSRISGSNEKIFTYLYIHLSCNLSSLSIPLWIGLRRKYIFTEIKDITQNIFTL
jgi:hypothetical protein